MAGNVPCLYPLYPTAPLTGCPMHQHHYHRCRAAWAEVVDCIVLGHTRAEITIQPTVFPALFPSHRFHPGAWVLPIRVLGGNKPGPDTWVVSQSWRVWGAPGCLAFIPEPENGRGGESMDTWVPSQSWRMCIGRAGSLDAWVPRGVGAEGEERARHLGSNPDWGGRGWWVAGNPDTWVPCCQH